MFKDSDYNANLLPDPANCAHCRALRYDTNVMVLQRLSELSTLSAVNLYLAIGCVMYLGTTLVCFVYTIDPGTVSDAVFHRLEFGGTFTFTLITTLALVFSPERRFQSPLVLKILVLINVCASFVAAILVFLSLKSFERLAHEIEYANEFCTAVVDVLILLTLEPSGDASQQRWQRSQLMVFAVAAACVPLVQLVVYNSDWGGEVRARYMEFIFNSTSAAVSFWFCTDSMFIADRLKLEIMLAPAELTVVIDVASRRAVHDHGGPRPPTPYSPPAVPPATWPSDQCNNCGNPNCLSRQPSGNNNKNSTNRAEPVAQSLLLPLALPEAQAAAQAEPPMPFRVSKGSLPIPAYGDGCVPCE